NAEDVKEIALAEELEILLDTPSSPGVGGGPVSFDQLPAGLQGLRHTSGGERLSSGAQSATEPLADANVIVASEMTPAAKRDRLKVYRARTKEGVSGKKSRIAIEALSRDLHQKGEALARQVRENEWLKDA